MHFIWECRVQWGLCWEGGNNDTKSTMCTPVVVDPVIRAAHGFLYRDTGLGVQVVGITMAELPRVSQ